jgi:PncC family amidohydrolase
VATVALPYATESALRAVPWLGGSTGEARTERSKPDLLRLWPPAAAGTGKTAEMFDTRLTALADSAARKLRERQETIAVVESSCGGLISASLLSIPGASAYYVGGTVTYTRVANQAFLAGAVAVPASLQAETEKYALYLAHAAAAKLETTWAIGESGAAGPAGSRYGDPAGHVWVAVAGATDSTRHLLTGSEDRSANMVAFAAAALDLLIESLG